MIVFHAFWEINVGLHLWGESSSLLADGSHIGKTRKKSDAHPFALSHDSLQEIIGNISGNAFLSNTMLGNLTALLPSVESLPRPSKDLLVCGFGDAAEVTDEIKLMPLSKAAETATCAAMKTA